MDHEQELIHELERLLFALRLKRAFRQAFAS